jgi:acetyl-CoA carboxylase biotin carboxyl carrier protein
VADDTSNIPSPFDLQSIRMLVRLMSRHKLEEIDLRQGELRIRLRRSGSATVPPTVSPPTPLVAPAAAPVAPAVAPPPEADRPAKPVHLIKSPTPGTFYTAPSPDAEPFVRVGSRVTPTTVVCVIEAMKIFNEIQAECAGIITEILVDNQQPVEYGQVLFKVDPTG